MAWVVHWSSSGLTLIFSPVVVHDLPDHGEGLLVPEPLLPAELQAAVHTAGPGPGVDGDGNEPLTGGIRTAGTVFAQVSPGVRAGIAAAEEIPSAGQLGSPALPTQGLVQVGDEELVQLQAGHRDQGLDVQLLPTEDGGGVGPAGMVEYRVCSVEGGSDVFLLAVIVGSECERVHLQRTVWI